MALEQLINDGNTTTTGSVNNTSDPVTVAVTAGSVFPSSGNFRIKIDDEIMLVTARSGNNLTASRAQEGTTIASHTSGAAVAFILTQASLRNVISQYDIYDSYSNLPAAGILGRKFHPTPGWGGHLRDNGTSWDLWYRDYGPLDPGIGNFATQVGFGSRGSVDISRGYTQLIDSGPGANADNNILCVQSSGSTPWVITLVFSQAAMHNSGQSGIVLRDSSSSRLKFYGYQWSLAGLQIYNYSALNTFNNNPMGAIAQFQQSGNPIMLRITNDGTTLTYSESRNFLDWNPIGHETVSGNYIANIDQVGFILNAFSTSDSNAGSSYMDIFHAKIT